MVETTVGRAASHSVGCRSLRRDCDRDEAAEEDDPQRILLGPSIDDHPEEGGHNVKMVEAERCKPQQEVGVVAAGDGGAHDSLVRWDENETEQALDGDNYVCLRVRNYARARRCDLICGHD